MPQAPVSPNPLLPPPATNDIGDAAWAQWFYHLYEKLLKDGGVFPAVRVQGKDGTGSFTADKNMFQRLISLDCGIYSDYYSDNGNIIYGFAANVRRSAGNNLTVAAQLNAWAPRGGNGGVVGVSTTALGAELFTGPLFGGEVDVGSIYNSNPSAKVGMSAVFKDRADEATTVNGVGVDRYNYYSSANWITSQSRSATGEKCGWTRGLSFLGECVDAQTPLAWNAAVTYSYGMVVTSGGFAWQAIQTSLNQVPAVPSVFWVPHTAAGVVALAIGIDFSCMPIATMARMSSAIRLRDTMRIDYDSTGAIGSYFDPVAGLHRLTNNVGALRFAVDVGSGLIHTSKAVDALGGGAAPVLGTIGGTGPTVAAQNSWLKVQTPLGATWIPIWI